MTRHAPEWTPALRAASAAMVSTSVARRWFLDAHDVLAQSFALRSLAPAANDNHRPDGKHEWPARDRLKSGRLMANPESNAPALVALQRLRDDLDAAAGSQHWATFGDDTAVDEEVQNGFGAELRRENVTAERLVALHLVDELEFREVGGHRVVCRRDGANIYELEDRLRGERGGAHPEHPEDVAGELASRYGGAAWPRDAKKPADIFMGAQMRGCSEERAATSPEDGIMRRAMARRRLAFLTGAMPRSLFDVLRQIADGATSEEIGLSRGHSGKRASAVGTELTRIALEALVEAGADYDGAAAA